MAIEQNKNIEKVTNSESFLEGYEGENGDVIENEGSVVITPEVVVEETGTPKSPQSTVKPVDKSVATINQGEGYSLEGSDKIDQNLRCSDANKCRILLQEAIEKKRAA